MEETTESEDNVLNKNIFPDSSEKMESQSIFSTIVKKVQGFKQKLKRFSLTRTKKRLMKVFEDLKAGDEIKALWRDRNPNLTQYHLVVKQNVLFFDLDF